MKRFSLQYILFTSRFDQVWFPVAFCILFMVIGLMRGQAYIEDTARAYLGAVIPLVSGILAAYAVLEDPALELRFATPVSSMQTLLERLVPTFTVQVLMALVFQFFALILHADFSTIYVNWVDLQFAWLVPTLSLMAFGSFTALAAARSATGAVLAGMMWMVQLVARSWFAGNRIGQYFLVFMSPFMTEHPALRLNQAALIGSSLILFLASWGLFHRQERYI